MHMKNKPLPLKMFTLGARGKSTQPQQSKVFTLSQLRKGKLCPCGRDVTHLHRDAQKPGTQLGQSYQQSPDCKVLSGRERPLLGFLPGSYRLRGDQSSRSFWKSPEESSCLWYRLCFLFLLEGWGIFPIFQRFPPSLLSWQKCILGDVFWSQLTPCSVVGFLSSLLGAVLITHSAAS